MFLGINLGTSEVKVLLLNDAGETRLAGSGGAPARVCTRMEATRVFEAEADIGRSEIPQQRLFSYLQIYRQISAGRVIPPQ